MGEVMRQILFTKFCDKEEKHGGGNISEWCSRVCRVEQSQEAFEQLVERSLAGNMTKMIVAFGNSYFNQLLPRFQKLNLRAKLLCETILLHGIR